MGWKRVPATLFAMAARSRWPAKTLTNSALENSARLACAPLRRRPSADGSAVTLGISGSKVRGWRRAASGSPSPRASRVQAWARVNAPA